MKPKSRRGVRRPLSALRLALRVAGLLVLALPPWPVVGRAYGEVVGCSASLLLSHAAAPVVLRFGSSARSSLEAGTVWSLGVEAVDPAGHWVRTALDTRRSAYLACAVFFALAVASPLRRTRRAALLLVGFVVLASLPLLPLVFFLSGPLPVQAFHPGPIAAAALEMAYHSLLAPPGMAYALPILLWLVLVWSLDDEGIRWLPVRWGPAPTDDDDDDDDDEQDR